MHKTMPPTPLSSFRTFHRPKRRARPHWQSLSLPLPSLRHPLTHFLSLRTGLFRCPQQQNHTPCAWEWFPCVSRSQHCTHVLTVKALGRLSEAHGHGVSRVPPCQTQQAACSEAGALLTCGGPRLVCVSRRPGLSCWRLGALPGGHSSPTGRYLERCGYEPWLAACAVHRRRVGAPPSKTLACGRLATACGRSPVAAVVPRTPWPQRVCTRLEEPGSWPSRMDSGT